ncbi:hypothetical protein HMPREF9103_00639 [Lentilactobacillus parafarraginis F0439]|uniref:Uncharacterized protein n=1 Tax=Lentilactobacillus parafarraginis F0439 TaxID=797515 RepID=G9ZLP1_9LACO|nr:hypothetical protein HMPREF9103_00639 [Lentilactobacillus parafarraginis F0439]
MFAFNFKVERLKYPGLKSLTFLVDIPMQVGRIKNAGLIPSNKI